MIALYECECGRVFYDHVWGLRVLDAADVMGVCPVCHEVCVEVLRFEEGYLPVWGNL